MLVRSDGFTSHAEARAHACEGESLVSHQSRGMFPWIRITKAIKPAVNLESGLHIRIYRM